MKDRSFRIKNPLFRSPANAERLRQSITLFAWIRKPEPLKLDLAGKWSRRINGEHRLVYEVMERNLGK